VNILYYRKCEEEGKLLATFGILIPQWHMQINNLAIIKSKNDGWFIAFPTHKDKHTQTWEKTVNFDVDASKKFMAAARKAVEDYAKSKGIPIASTTLA